MESSRRQTPAFQLAGLGLTAALALAAVLWSTTCKAPQGKAPRRPAGAGSGAVERTNVETKGNRLRDARSAYLRQHARNPVDWYPWGPEALGRARREGKPIFLSIGYASCHWCHVMEREVFERPEVARVMNEGFINIKVDREERPDLDAVYMEAVQAMTGSGGWPMSVFLTPELKPFHGGTYFPRDRFVALMRRVLKLYRTRRGELEGRAERLRRVLAAEPQAGSASAVDREAIDDAAAAVAARFDPTWGGLKGRMKFPSPSTWRFVLRHHRKTGAKQSARMVRRTLDSLASGGIYDQLGGGFHRYAVEPTWLVPHFEKMLYDNAQLADLYLEAARVFDSPRYARVARETLDFLLRRMRSPKGGAFFASYDADSEGEEGRFYLWTPAELRAVAGKADGALLADLLGVTAKGNLDGRSVPSWRAELGAVARSHLRTTAEVRARWRRLRPTLRDARARRSWPKLDRKVITAWNGLAIAAFARAYRALGETRYLDAARGAAEHLWRVHRVTKTGRLRRSSYGGVAENEGVLDDYAFFADGLLELFYATRDPRHLRRARALVAVVARDFARPAGGYYLTPEGHTAPLGRQLRTYDGVRPAGQSALLEVMLELAALAGSGEQRRRVSEGLAAFAGRMRRAPLSMLRWYDVAQQLAGPFYEVVVAGDARDRRTAALLAAVDRRLPAHAVLIAVPAAGPTAAQRKLLPPVEGKRALAARPTAFVCRFGACKLPTSRPAVLARQLLEGWTR